MTTLAGRTDGSPGGIAPPSPTRPIPDVVELQLLLPRWQVSALEEAARVRGMTTGQILRRIISDQFADASPPGG